jgi:hypothetical protein
MPLQATSGAASYDAFGGGVPFVPTYIEDVFSTWLYTGNGSTQTITNGIDLAGKGGLVWIKSRSATTNHFLFDSNRGVLNEINSNNTEAQASLANSVTAYNANGFSLGSAAGINVNAATYASWTFRKQPKFFDVVTWTGDGTTFRTLVHNLKVKPALVIIKRTDSTSDWATTLFDPETYLALNSTGANGTGISGGYAQNATATELDIQGNAGNVSGVNASGGTYVAYLFASNAGGFGLTGTDNVISCGSFTTGASGNASVTLGYEPQWVMYKLTTASDSWFIVDNMRGMPNTNSSTNRLIANGSGAEQENQNAGVRPTATGFNAVGLNGSDPGGTVIYIAIRRGPMKVPTTGTSVFSAYITSNDGTPTNIGFNSDLAFHNARVGSSLNTGVGDRLRGFKRLVTTRTDAESTQYPQFFNTSNVFWWSINGSGIDTVMYNFRRAPGFFDVVCYTGTGAAQTVPHSLGVVPELILSKQRNAGGSSWIVYASGIGNTNYLVLDSSAGSGSGSAWNNTTPTSTGFSVNNFANNRAGSSNVAYLFATCPGVSKVGSYTGNGSSQTLNMGFTGGARFFLVKRTDSTGDWWVYDSARGIVSSSDPALRLNSTAAEVTSADAVDTDSTGLIVNQESTCNINVNGATYIYLGIS